MKKENLITIAVIGGLILLGIGFSLGLSSGQKAIKEVKAPLVDLSESKVIGSLDIVASGEITEITGRNLTLTKEGDALTISIREDTSIYRKLLPGEVGGVTEKPQPAGKKEIKFEEIKVGDKVNIACELKSGGVLEGKEVTVLP